MALGKYVDLGLGIRYDVSRTKANESTISVGKFKISLGILVLS